MGHMRQARLTALYDYARQLVQSGKAGLFDFISHLRQLLENGDAPTLGTAQAADGRADHRVSTGPKDWSSLW